jgi:hypothetical protein
MAVYQLNSHCALPGIPFLQDLKSTCSSRNLNEFDGHVEVSPSLLEIGLCIGHLGNS